MFDYKFITIKPRNTRNFSFKEDYKNLIQENAIEGWRFIQVVPTKWNSYGNISEVEIVLERPHDWEKFRV